MPVQTLSYSTRHRAKDTLYNTGYRVHVLYSGVAAPMRKGEAVWYMYCTMYGRQVQLYLKLPVLEHCVAL